MSEWLFEQAPCWQARRFFLGSSRFRGPLRFNHGHGPGYQPLYSPASWSPTDHATKPLWEACWQANRQQSRAFAAKRSAAGPLPTAASWHDRPSRSNAKNCSRHFFMAHREIAEVRYAFAGLGDLNSEVTTAPLWGLVRAAGRCKQMLRPASPFASRLAPTATSKSVHASDWKSTGVSPSPRSGAVLRLCGNLLHHVPAKA